MTNVGGKSMIQQTADRIRQMEFYFDMLQKVASENPNALREDTFVKASLQALTQYYESGQWLRDYELDEKGLLPPNLKPPLPMRCDRQGCLNQTRLWLGKQTYCHILFELFAPIKIWLYLPSWKD